MKKLIVKIEQESIQLIRVERTKEELLITEFRSFDMPNSLNNNIKENPHILAGFIKKSVESSGFDTDGAVLLFDGQLGFFKEYIHKKSNKSIEEKLFFMEGDNQKDTKDSSVIVQRQNYPDDPTMGQMKKAAIYGVDDSFMRELVKHLSANGIIVEYATSTLVLFKKTIDETIKLIKSKTEDYSRIIGLDISAKSFRAVVTEEKKLIHLEEFVLPKDTKPKDKNLADMLTGFLKEYAGSEEKKGETLVILSGTGDAQKSASRLTSYSGVTCKSIMDYYEEIRDTFELSGELKDKDEVFPKIFGIAGINIKKYKDENFLYGGWSKRRFSKATSKICIGVSIVVVLLFCMLPAYNYYIFDKNKEYKEEIEKSGYSDHRKLLSENRELLSKLQVYKDDLKSISDSNITYSEVLTTLRTDLLKDSVINDLFYDEESGLIIDFDVTNIKEYENARDKLNDERKIIIVETATGTAVSGIGQNCQIKVTMGQ